MVSCEPSVHISSVKMHHVQMGEACGNMNEPCCYGDDDAPLCAAGDCAPSSDITDFTDIKQLKCVCSETVCVKNVQYCPIDTVCQQSDAELEACGQEGDPCCNGISCDEDVLSDKGGEAIVDLACNQSFFDKETGQSTRCEFEVQAEVRLQSFDGCGNAFEKCCSGDRCDDEEFECRCAGPCTGIHQQLFRAAPSPLKHEKIRCAVGACLPAANCSLAGDSCCDGDQCANEFLRCSEATGSILGMQHLQ
jgi:hypothetical protein